MREIKIVSSKEFLCVSCRVWAQDYGQI